MLAIHGGLGGSATSVEGDIGEVGMDVIEFAHRISLPVAHAG